MRLLVITFELDEKHPALAWQVYVVRELSRCCEKVLVLTSRISKDIDLPANVEVIIPPVRPLGVPHRFGGRWAFNFEMNQLLRKNAIDAVFIHMAMEWGYILCPTFKHLKLPTVMWYAHGTVTKRLKLAIQCVDKVVTSTPEGCRVDSKKIKVIGQAINTSLFSIPERRDLQTILYVGRISRRKRVDLLYQVYKSLRKDLSHAEISSFDVIGMPLTDDDMHYEQDIKQIIKEQNDFDKFRMRGFVPFSDLPVYYRKSFLHINVSETGSMDKTVMEALSCGCPVLTSNPAFREILSDYPEFFISDEHPDAIAEQVLTIYNRRSQYDPLALRALVLNDHGLDTYAQRVLSVFDDITREKDQKYTSRVNH